MKENVCMQHRYNEELYQTDEDGIDIITLRYTLLQCRKQLLSSIKSLIDTEFGYSKVELREDFDQLKNRCENLKIETDLLKTNFQALTNDCKLLIQQTTDILSERDSYYSEWQYARNILTPRPDWDKCSPLITHWQNLSLGKTSEQLVDVVINEIVHGNTEENNDEYFPMNITELTHKNTFFHQLSIDSSFENKLIKNRHMRRRITGLLIKEIWSKKLSAANKLETQLTDYVFDYLTKRFDSRELAMEIGYNFQDACHRYRNNYQINLFWQILTGQMEENVYHDEMKEFARILQYFIKLSSHSAAQSVGNSLLKLLWTIQWSELIQALHELYPNWTNERISHVMMSAERELQQSSTEKSEFEFLLLFMEDDEGHIGEFLTSIREQLQFDKYEYVEKIKNILIRYPLISIKQFKQAVQLVDPLISKKELRRYVTWVFEPKKIFLTVNKEGQLAKINENTQMRDFEEIIFRLERCSCFMH